MTVSYWDLTDWLINTQEPDEPEEEEQGTLSENVVEE